MFELSDELVRQIIFAMENQNNRYVIDTELGVLTRVDTLEEEHLPDLSSVELDISRRYQPLPEWTSADGFQLMERFLGELHNPMARNNLQEILLSGKRVFRRFKDTMREYPEVEKRYYRYKFLEMRRVVWEWYTRLRELAGLDALEVGADEELDDLVLTEITVKPLRDPAPDTILDLDQRAFVEAYPDLPGPLRDHLYGSRLRRDLVQPDDPRSILLGAYTPLEDLCGILWALREEAGAAVPVVEIHQLFVFPEFRGLGVATSLLERLLREERDDAGGYVISRLPGGGAPAKALMRSLEFQELRREYLAVPGNAAAMEANATETA